MHMAHHTFKSFIASHRIQCHRVYESIFTSFAEPDFVLSGTHVRDDVLFDNLLDRVPRDQNGWLSKWPDFKGREFGLVPVHLGVAADVSLLVLAPQFGQIYQRPKKQAIPCGVGMRIQEPVVHSEAKYPIEFGVPAGGPFRAKGYLAPILQVAGATDANSERQRSMFAPAGIRRHIRRPLEFLSVRANDALGDGNKLIAPVAVQVARHGVGRSVYVAVACFAIRGLVIKGCPTRFNFGSRGRPVQFVYHLVAFLIWGETLSPF